MLLFLSNQAKLSYQFLSVKKMMKRLEVRSQTVYEIDCQKSDDFRLKI